MRTRRGGNGIGCEGFSLVEMLLVVVMLGIASLMAMPRIERALVQRDLAGARAATASLILRAKAAAVQKRRPVTLTVDSTLAVLTVPVGSGSQHLAVVHVKGTFGVVARASASALTVQPTGLVNTGTPFTIRFAKGGLVDSLRITGYGRVE